MSVPLRTFQITIVTTLTLLACDRQKATNRVSESVNPKEVKVVNGQAAILRLRDGYAAIFPTYIRHDEIAYRVFVSSDGVFQSTEEPIREGVATTATPFEVGGVRVFVGYGGKNTASVMLDSFDNTTGIGVFPTNDLSLLEVSRIRFEQGKMLNPDDLMKAIEK